MNISNVAYHGEIQKKAAMERQRELTDVIDIRGKCPSMSCMNFYDQSIKKNQHRIKFLFLNKNI
jgi:hypothetical protein